MQPKVILHNSISIDGRINQFTPNIGIHYEIAAKFNFQAHLAGSNTIFNPEENISEEIAEDFEKPEKVRGDKRALLVVPDSKGIVKNWHGLRRSGYWRGFVALISKKTPKRYINYLEKRHINYIIAGPKKVDLKKALSILNKKYKVRSILLDSGGILNGVMLREGLVDEISLLFHPNLAGEEESHSFYRAEDLKYDGGTRELKLMHHEKLKGDIIWLRYKVI
jgi:2,5-diamino-6-(ribosylamino)-4(3H)-pyrimidinone 5'-phosphate reductase